MAISANLQALADGLARIYEVCCVPGGKKRGADGRTRPSVSRAEKY